MSPTRLPHTVFGNIDERVELRPFRVGETTLVIYSTAISARSIRTETSTEAQKRYRETY